MDSKTEPANDRERIENDGEIWADTEDGQNLYDMGQYGLVHSYIAGATAEHNRALEEITRLKAELERERELRKEALVFIKEAKATIERLKEDQQHQQPG